MTAVDTQELGALVRREHSNPHSILGPHEAGEGVVIRTLRPGALRIAAQPGGTENGIELEQIHPSGVFEGLVDHATVHA